MSTSGGYSINNGPSALDEGLLGWSMDPMAASGASLMGSAGVLRGARLRVDQGGLCTGIILGITGPGAALTAGENFCALYSLAGVFIVQTVDLSVIWAAGTGNPLLAWSAPVALAAGEYYAGYWWNGTTAPTIARGAIGGGANFGNTPNQRAWAAGAGLTNVAPGNIGNPPAATSNTSLIGLY